MCWFSLLTWLFWIIFMINCLSYRNIVSDIVNKKERLHYSSFPFTFSGPYRYHFKISRFPHSWSRSLWRPSIFISRVFLWDTLYVHFVRNIDKLEAVQRRATRWITRSDDDYDTRLSKLKLLSLSDRRFIRDVTFLFNVINSHYDISISNKLIFCKDRSTSYNLRKMIHRTLFQTVLLMNGIFYLIILEN